jgi:hypothetical protein
MTTFALRPRTFRDAMIREPIQLAISQPHQVLISSISVSLMAIFFASSGAVPAAAAWAGAVGVEYAYLKGLSDAAYTRSEWGMRLVWGAFAIIVIAGISVLLRDAYHMPWMVSPPAPLAVLLAVLHILPLAFIGLCSANLHMEAEGQRVAADRAVIDRAKDMEQEEQEYQRERERRRKQFTDDLEVERARKALDIESYEAATLAKQRLRAAANTAAANTANTGPHDASGTGTNSVREQQRAHVVRTLREHPDTNKTQLAKELQIGRTLLYALIAEAKDRGEL